MENMAPLMNELDTEGSNMCFLTLSYVNNCVKKKVLLWNNQFYLIYLKLEGFKHVNKNETKISFPPCMCIYLSI